MFVNYRIYSNFFDYVFCVPAYSSFSKPIIRDLEYELVNLKLKKQTLMV